MPRGYGYGNARFRAMRSRLLTERNYSTLLDKANIEELISALAETPYREDLETALVRMGLEALIARCSAKRLAALGGTEPKIRNIPRRRASR